MRAYYQNDVLEITNIADDEGGWFIRTGKDGVFELYESTIGGGNEYHIGSFSNIVDAMKEANKLT